MQRSRILDPYSKPPITEAVIGINFENEISLKDIISVSKKYSKHYTNSQAVKNINVEISKVGDSEKKPVTNVHEILGHRLSSDNMTQLLVIWPATFTISQLAPYSGWDDFFGRFVRDWKIWKRKFKHKKISRVGVRYINRIDIPTSDSIVQHEDFLNIYPRVPESIATLDAYSVNIVTRLDHISCHLKINSAVVPSPILDHTSFLIDQDIYIDSSPPQKDDDIYTLLNLIRVEKNKVFESCVSDKARELFQE